MTYSKEDAAIIQCIKVLNRHIQLNASGNSSRERRIKLTMSICKDEMLNLLSEDGKYQYEQETNPVNLFNVGKYERQ